MADRVRAKVTVGYPWRVVNEHRYELRTREDTWVSVVGRMASGWEVVRSPTGISLGKHATLEDALAHAEDEAVRAAMHDLQSSHAAFEAARMACRALGLDEDTVMLAEVNAQPIRAEDWRNIT